MLQWATNSVPLLREIDEFVKSEQQQLLDILEFGPFYRDITNIVEDEANVTRRIAKIAECEPAFRHARRKKITIQSF